MAETEKKNLKPTELAKRLSVSLSTLSTWRMSGKGPKWFYASGDSCPRYPIEEVEKFEQDLRDHI